MSFLSSIKKVLNIGQTEKKKKLVLQNIKVCTYILHLRSKYCLIVLFPTLNFECYKAVKTFSNLYFLLGQDDVDPEQFWEIIGELGDGAFGKVIL